jgi:hypothetical protein
MRSYKKKAPELRNQEIWHSQPPSAISSLLCSSAQILIRKTSELLRNQAPSSKKKESEDLLSVLTGKGKLGAPNSKSMKVCFADQALPGFKHIEFSALSNKSSLTELKVCYANQALRVLIPLNSSVEKINANQALSGF